MSEDEPVSFEIKAAVSSRKVTMLGDLGTQRLSRTARCKVNSKGPLSQTRGRKKLPRRTGVRCPKWTTCLHEASLGSLPGVGTALRVQL